MKMRLSRNISHFELFYLLLCFEFQQTYSEVDTHLFESHDTLVNDYRRYRNELGCLAPLCSEIDNLTDLNIPQSNHSNSGRNNASNVNNTNCCSTCSCSDDCLRDGNCCPDKLTKEFIMSSIYPVGGIFDCGNSGVKPEPDVTRNKVKVISKCIRTFDQTDTIEACTTQAATKLENYRIVSHKTTHDAYKNIHCARCNDVRDTDVVPWPIKVNCQKGIFLPENMSEIVSEIRRSDHCNVVFDPPQSFRGQYCKPMISKCNETGLLRKNESLVLEEACEAFVSEFRSGHETYRNTFCYLCNTGNTREHNCLTHEKDGSIHEPYIPELTLSFTALLDFTESTTVTESRACEINSVYDLFKVCFGSNPK